MCCRDGIDADTGVIAEPPPVAAALFLGCNAAQEHSDAPAPPMRRSALLVYHVRKARQGRSRSYRLGGRRETVCRRNEQNFAQKFAAKHIAPTRAPITAVSVRGQAGNDRSLEECFYGDANRVRMAEKLVAVVTVLHPCLLFVCLVQGSGGTSTVGDHNTPPHDSADPISGRESDTCIVHGVP